jgi:hypothetical protein
MARFILPGMPSGVNSDPDWANARVANVNRTKIPVIQKNLDTFTVPSFSFYLFSFIFSVTTICIQTTESSKKGCGQEQK